MLRRWTALAVALLAFPALAAKIPVGENSVLNVGVLLQTQGALSGGGAPNGGLGTDFYLRRIRLLVHGQVTQRISFFVDVDQPNLGKDGDWGPAFYIQDALLSYAAIEKQLFFDAGMIIAPLAHHSIQGAGSLNTLDYHSGLIKYAAGKVWRDVGVQARAFAFDSRLHIRAGLFNGIEGRAERTGADPLPALNIGDAPRLAGHARWNFLGKEEGFFLSGIYFAQTPLLSVGLGGDWQPGALTGNRAYYAAAADVFLEYPTLPDQEVIFQANVFRFFRGAASLDSGTGTFAEVGYRIAMIEPVFAFEYFDGDVAGADMLAFRPGVNLWVDKHTFNVKFEVGLTRQGNLREAPLGVTGALQAQLSF